MSEIEGRVALVTGAARGIGFAISELLARAGASVMMTDVLEAEGAASAEKLRQTGRSVAFMRHDVTSEADWASVISACEAKFGWLDILVNNAGIFIGKPTAETSIEDFRKVQQVNVDGVFLGIKHAVPALAKRAGEFAGGGAIVNMSSIGAMLGTPDTIAYSSSKGAVRSMTKVAAVDCGRKGLRIRVNSVHPGVIQTDMGQQVVDELGGSWSLDQEQMQQQLLASHPIGRLGTPEDIANAVLFLVSDAAAFATGAEFTIDGGMSAV